MSDVTGRVYALPRLIEITREQVADFAVAIGEPDPIYRDAVLARSRGHRDIPAPLTYLARLLPQLMEPVLQDARSDIDAITVVHRDQRFDFARTVYAGDRLRVVVSVTRFSVVMNARPVTVRCDFTDEAGGEVCRMTTSLVGLDNWVPASADRG